MLSPATFPDSPFCAATFRDDTQAREALARLSREGFAPRRLAVIAPSAPDGSVAARLERPSGGRRALRAAPAGALVGSLLGACLALAVQAVSGAGLLVAPLITAAGGGAVFGALVAAMIARGRELHVSEWADQAAREDHIVVAVLPRSDVSEPSLETAAPLLHDCGAGRVVAPV